MDIEKEIINLLTTQCKVVLTGFGSFTTIDKMAEIHPVNNTFNPPSKSVIFKLDAADTDNSFVNHLSAVYNTPSAETLIIVNKLITDIKNNLEKFGKHIFEGFGLLSLNQSGEYSFELNPNVNLSAENIGMESFTSPAIKREKAEPQKAAPQKKRSKVWIIILILFFLLIGASVGAYFLFPEQVKKYINYAENQYNGIMNKASKKEESTKNNDVDSNNVHKKAITDVSDTLNKEPKNNSTNTKSNTVVKSIEANSKMYYIVAGSFKSKENAEKFVNELKAKSYPNAVLLDNLKKGLYTVAYDRFTDKETANQELIKINSKEKSGSWIILK